MVSYHDVLSLAVSIMTFLHELDRQNLGAAQVDLIANRAFRLQVQLFFVALALELRPKAHIFDLRCIVLLVARPQQRLYVV